MNVNFLLFISIISTLVSCQVQQETNVDLKPFLKVDELYLPIPENMPNDWYNLTGSIEDRVRVLHIYDKKEKNIIQYSIDEEKILNKVNPFFDTLDPGNIPVSLYRIENGYFLDAGAKLGFLVINDQGDLINIWNYFRPISNIITNWEYNFKYSLRSSKTSKLSMFDGTTIPIYIELANVLNDAVYSEDFYDHDIFASLNLKTGNLTRHVSSFPDSFKVGRLSFPELYIPSFTATFDNKIAYSFGFEKTVYFLDLTTNEVSSVDINNPSFQVNMKPVSRESFLNREYYKDFSSNFSFYAGLFYDPYNSNLVRMGVKRTGTTTSRLFEIIDKEMNIVGQFEQPLSYSPIPVFFLNEILFPYLQGYKEDTMKLMRVRY